MSLAQTSSSKGFDGGLHKMISLADTMTYCTACGTAFWGIATFININKDTGSQVLPKHEIHSVSRWRRRASCRSSSSCVCDLHIWAGGAFSMAEEHLDYCFHCPKYIYIYIHTLKPWHIFSAQYKCLSNWETVVLRDWPQESCRRRKERKDRVKEGEKETERRGGRERDREKKSELRSIILYEINFKILSLRKKRESYFTDIAFAAYSSVIWQWQYSHWQNHRSVDLNAGC